MPRTVFTIAIAVDVATTSSSGADSAVQGGGARTRARRAGEPFQGPTASRSFQSFHRTGCRRHPRRLDRGVNAQPIGVQVLPSSVLTEMAALVPRRAPV